MLKEKPAPKPIRYYAGTKKVFARMVDMGVRGKDIYEGWEPSEHWSKITLKSGERLGTVDGLRSFGGKVAIRKALERFHGQGVTVHDIVTGQDSKTHGVTMRDAALEPEKPSEAYLAEKRRQEIVDRAKMSEREMLVHWRNPKLKLAEVLALIGLTRSLAYQLLKPRGVGVGRPPKHLAD
jgi:hypothetical protein